MIAARLIYERQETEYYRARIQAARLVSSEPNSAQPVADQRRNPRRSTGARDRCRKRTNRPVPQKFDRVFADETPSSDPFREYLALLLPLEQVKQSPVYHPEGDALYHSLQVFTLARDQLAYGRRVPVGRAAA